LTRKSWVNAIYAGLYLQNICRPFILEKPYAWRGGACEQSIMPIKRLTLVLLLSMLGTTLRAETVNCTPITSLPATINSQGIYCLTGNLSTSQTSGNAITINANNVTLDLNGWKLGGQAAGLSTTANGIYSTGNSVTIENGTIRGFSSGIAVYGSGAVVKDVLIDECTVIGMLVASSDAHIVHNRITNIGGSTADDIGSATGVSADYPGITISNNTITNITATGSGWAVGIIAGQPSSTFRDNTISNAAIPTNGTTSYGIFGDGSVVVNNAVSNFTYCIYNLDGIYAFNTVSNCTTNYFGGTAGFGNSP
jgi:hypothetical protein